MKILTIPGLKVTSIEGRRRIRLSIWWKLIAACLLVSAIGLFILLSLPNAERAAQRDLADTLKAVGKLYELPDEVPVLAVVTEKEKLTQPFFAQAENGDKVLVFNKAQKIVLYRPSTKKIINLSNFNPTDLPLEAQLPDQQINQPTTPKPTPAPTTSSAAVKDITIAIYNGTAIAGLTQKIQQKLLDASASATVVARSNAASDQYGLTTVIALTPAGEAQAQSIASILGVAITTLPEGEVSPSADILIITGNDAAAF